MGAGVFNMITFVLWCLFWCGIACLVFAWAECKILPPPTRRPLSSPNFDTWLWHVIEYTESRSDCIACEAELFSIYCSGGSVEQAGETILAGINQ